jgi:hypothetical protein
MFAFLAPLLSFLGGPVISGLIGAYKAKLDAGNTAEHIAADLAARELAVEQREAEVSAQITIAEEGRWWTALPRAMVQYAFAIFIVKAVVWDKVLGWGSTDPLGGDIASWAGMVMAMWFGGRTIEKVARIIKR